MHALNDLQRTAVTATEIVGTSKEMSTKDLCWGRIRAICQKVAAKVWGRGLDCTPFLVTQLRTPAFDPASLTVKHNMMPTARWHSLQKNGVARLLS